MEINFREKSELIRSLSNNLNENEIDALKYRISVEAVNVIADDGHIIHKEEDKFNLLLENLISIQGYKNRVPEYGLAYKNRPNFMTDSLLENLVQESERFKSRSHKNLDQYIYQVEEKNNNTYAETLAISKELHDLVNKFAGKSLQSFVTSYLYYNKEGQYSRPHVDNAFTSITAMIGLKNLSQSSNVKNQSSSFIYWPNKPRLNYQLMPGEIAIFFGACVLHGRTEVGKNEEINSLLISFRPEEV